MNWLERPFRKSPKSRSVENDNRVKSRIEISAKPPVSEILVPQFGRRKVKRSKAMLADTTALSAVLAKPGVSAKKTDPSGDIG